jgi:hypothetical protein
VTGARVVVAGSCAAAPGHGGWTWALLQYVLGLRQLGHRVHWIDPLGADAVRPAGAPLAASDNAAYFRAVVAAFGLEGDATLLRQAAPVETLGASPAELQTLAAESDVLLNISGALSAGPLLAGARRRVYVDLDPGYTQVWEVISGIDLGLDAHTDFVTIGVDLDRSAVVPRDGRRWRPTPQPVVLSWWPDARGRPPALDAFTTVANWRAYGTITHAGVSFGQKAHSFRQFLELPRLTRERFVLALGIHQDERRDREALAAAGWLWLDPVAVAATPGAYRRFVQGSAAELAIAKSGYVNAPTGWFSDRSVCYLASGRPVVAQDTGFGAFLPVGAGLLAFRSLEEAADAVARVRRDYGAHAAAARRLAEAHFDARRVLGSLLRDLEVAA